MDLAIRKEIRSMYTPAFLARADSNRLRIRREQEARAKAEAKAERERQRQIALNAAIAAAVAAKEETTRKIEARKLTELERIRARAMRVFNVSRAELNSEIRIAGVVEARQFIAYWARRRTLLSYPLIGKLLGNRDHTTIIHGKKAYVRKRAAAGRTLREVR